MPQTRFSLRFSGVVLAVLLMTSRIAAQTPIQIYGAWHCYTDGCSWASVPNMTTFDTDNRWLIDRNMNGTYQPSVNLVILSFVDPVKLMNKTTDSGDTNGIPVGMNTAVINYFQSHGVRVMMSIGGASYKKDWDKALSTNPTQLGINAANAAKQFGVGMEIDYENSSSPNLTGLAAFVNAYRSVVPYDPTGANPAARLTIDLGAGDQYLTNLSRYATANWLNDSAPVLDYANAMVPNKQPTSASSAESNWQQHITGKANYAPPVPPLAPNRLTGSLYIVTGKNPAPECNNFSASLENSTGNYVQTVAPNGAG